MDETKPLNKIALVIPLQMKNILDHLVQKPLEWTAFGELEEIKSDEGMFFILKDIAFPKQENASASTEVKPEDFAEFGEMLHKAKKPTNKYKLWIHSHNTMSAFWSGTDTGQMDDFKGGDYMLSLVVSTTNWKSAFNLYKPVRLDFDIPFIIQDNVTEQSILDAYKTELEKNEKVCKYEPPTKWNEKDWRSGYPHGDYDYDTGQPMLQKTGVYRANNYKKDYKLSKKEMKALYPLSGMEKMDYEDYKECGYTHEECMRAIKIMREQEQQSHWNGLD